MRSLLLYLVLLGMILTPAAVVARADEFRLVSDKQEFVTLISGRSLARLGISLRVSPDGQIAGSAFGQTVRGAWSWKGGYFCRDLRFGSRELEPNCQAVLIRGDTLRFVSDRGKGEYADLWLR